MLYTLATDCHSAVLATPAGVFLHKIFISSIVQIFLAIHAVPAVPIMVDFFLHVSSESGLCSEVSDDVHQGIAACMSFVFFLWVAYLYMRLSLFFSPFGFVRCASVLRMNSFLYYIYIFEGLFCLARANPRLRLVFSSSLLFSFAFGLPI